MACCGPRRTSIRLIGEIAEDEAAAGSRWLELQVTPTGYAARLGDLVTATEVFCDAAAAAERATGVGIRLVIAANRTRPPWEAETLARLAVRFSPYGVVGFGLSNDERRAAPEDFAKAFRIARDGGLISLPHAGELLGAEPPWPGPSRRSRRPGSGTACGRWRTRR